MNSNPADPAWKKFLALCRTDDRILVLEETLARGSVLALIKHCDAYVSLHRAEGLGRTLAEAMLLGKPVIATNFSGNVDFMESGLTFPVKWKWRKVELGEYPFITEADHAHWADPDLNSAAEQMRNARIAGRSLATTITTYARSMFSPSTCGRRMIQRLEHIGQESSEWRHGENS